MSQLAERAKPAVQKLSESDESQLYEELGLRLKAMAADERVSGSFEPQVSYDAQLMGAANDLRAFGKKFFEKFSREAYGLVCGDGLTADERAKLNAALGNKVDFAAWLAAILVAHFAIAPAIAAVIGALVLKLFFRPAQQAMCEVWATKIAS